MQLSAYSLHLFTLPISGPKKSQEFLLKGFFFISYLLTAAKMAICLSRGKRELGMVFFFVLLFPNPWPELFLKVYPVSVLIWATACGLLLGFCSVSFHVTQ